MVLRRMLLMLAAVAVVVLALAAYKGYSIYQQVQMFSAPPPPVSVEAEPARTLQWQQRIPAIGTLKSVQGVDLTAEISGTVSEVLFESGQRVERGQLLLRLSSEVEQASLKSAEAALALANVERNRARNLVGSSAISRSEFDRLNAEAQQAQASVEQLRATLEKRQVLAPFSGRIGLSQVERGDFLAAGAPIATLQDLSSLEVDFALPEQRAPQLSVGQRVLMRAAAYPDEHFQGEIIALNPRVDDSTRNLQIRARLANPEERLLPGMFAQLEVILPETPRRVVVPETAVTYSLYGDALYVVKEQDGEDGQKQQVAERRFVNTGERRDGLVVIEQGLQDGEWVVTSGQLKLDHGTPVSLAPAAAHAQLP